MSFDLMVFDPASVPLTDRAAFMEWYNETTTWSGKHDYNDPASASQPLQAWYGDIRIAYLPLNGPYAEEHPDADAYWDDPKLTDYSISPDAIYAAFSWSEAAGAFETVTRLAAEHEVGFFDVSSEDGGVWVPDGKGGMQRVF